MTKEYKIQLTETENLALSHVALNPQDWIDNAVHERCRVAIDEIVQLTVEKCFATNTRLPNTKEDMVDLAFLKGWIKTAADRQKDIEQDLGL
jgi:hypothetical protein